jgi:type I restriction enzyme S subunit
MEVVFPLPKEQQRIADCLISVDDLIAAQIQKLDAVKTHKKGMMQQLFPSPEEIEA